MKIAVVGSGVSGLVCAHYLSPRHEVHVFEAGDHVGGHTNTIPLRRPSGDYAVDTGFIVFNDWTYPNFIRLLSDLGVDSQPSTMSFSVHVEATGLEYNGTDLNRLFVQRRNLFRPSFYRMIRDILRFNREAPGVLDGAASADLTLGAYLKRGGYSAEFVQQYIVPMGAAVWSSSVEKMRDFPARTFIQFFKNHGMLSVDDRPQWRVVRGGSWSYVKALVRRLKHPVRLNTPVQAVRRTSSSAVVSYGGERPGSEEFDHVILAGHSDQSLRILSDAAPREREILEAIGYQENRTVLHTDTAVLPVRRAAWASWNYRVPARPQNRVAVSYNMNFLQTLDAPETFCVSLNMEERVPAPAVLKKILYHHPVYNAAAVAAQRRWAEISGPERRTHFCGAYWGYGFHEDGVNSARRVCESMGIAL